MLTGLIYYCFQIQFYLIPVLFKKKPLKSVTCKIRQMNFNFIFCLWALKNNINIDWEDSLRIKQATSKGASEGACLGWEKNSDKWGGVSKNWKGTPSSCSLCFAPPTVMFTSCAFYEMPATQANERRVTWIVNI